MFDKRTETIEENNLILKTMLRNQVNSLILQIESLSPEQLKSKTVLETYKDSLENTLLYYYQNHSLNDADKKSKEKLLELREKIQLKILKLELDEISSNKPPIAIIKNK